MTSSPITAQTIRAIPASQFCKGCACSAKTVKDCMEINNVAAAQGMPRCCDRTESIHGYIYQIKEQAQ